MILLFNLIFESQKQILSPLNDVLIKHSTVGIKPVLFLILTEDKMSSNPFSTWNVKLDFELRVLEFISVGSLAQFLDF